jgi:hypothetical protein
VTVPDREADVAVTHIDNFARHLWMTIGGIGGVVITAIGGWPIGLGWLVGYGGGGLLFYGLVSGRIVLRRKESA